MPIKPEDEATIRPQLELLHSLRDVVESNLHLLAPVADAWQPTDYLPDLSNEDWVAQLSDFRSPAQQLSDELLVVLVGDMVTEEALPNYAVSLNLIVDDQDGASTDPWAKWLRGWTAEENRHGDLLNAFLRLTGRVNMRSVEVTVHHLLANGFSPRTYPHPYAGMVYTSFQERATKISHARVGGMAIQQDNKALGKICGKIAHDESHHEEFYTNIMSAVFERDPDTAVQVFRYMMRRVIAMPGRLMFDGQDPDLFEHFSAVAQRTGVYTVYDYISILEHLVRHWKIASLKVSGKAAMAQEYLCSQAERISSQAEYVVEKVNESPKMKFAWINDRLA